MLGLPPAFALSQDQTLKLDENFTRLITTFDEVPLLCARDEREHDLRLTRSTSARSRGVDLKRRPPKSLHDRNAKGFPFAKAARKDSAVHVSLSSYSPIKQPGARAPSPVSTGAAETPRIRHGHTIMAGCSITEKTVRGS